MSFIYQVPHEKDRGRPEENPGKHPSITEAHIHPPTTHASGGEESPSSGRAGGSVGTQASKREDAVVTAATTRGGSDERAGNALPPTGVRLPASKPAEQAPLIYFTSCLSSYSYRCYSKRREPVNAGERRRRKPAGRNAPTAAACTVAWLTMVQVRPRGDAPRAAASARSEQRWHLTYVAAPWPIRRREAAAAKMSTRSRRRRCTQEVYAAGGHQPAAMQARTPSSSSSMVRLFLPLGSFIRFHERQGTHKEKTRSHPSRERRAQGGGAYGGLARDGARTHVRRPARGPGGGG